MDNNAWGICPKFLKDMLRFSEGNKNFTFHASAVEVYFDDCFDLLNKKAKIPIAGQSKIKMKSKKGNNGGYPAFGYKSKKGFDQGESYAAQGCQEIQITSESDIKNVMATVESTRSSKSHALNERSSRSHCIFTLKCTQRNGSNLKQSRFLFVDLAGSERVNKSGAK